MESEHPVLAALKTFDAGDIMNVACEAVEFLRVRIENGVSSEAASHYAQRIGEAFRLAWLLEQPGMAKAIAAESPNHTRT